MKYWNRVLNALIVLVFISAMIVLLFYFSGYEVPLQNNTVISIISIVLILGFILPVASHHYKRKSIQVDSIANNWIEIIKEHTTNSHHFKQVNNDKIILVKKEHFALQWFYLGRRNTWIIKENNELVFYGPEDVTDDLISRIFN